MKTINAYLSVAMATLSLSLTSCLGNGKNEISMPQQACVIVNDPTTYQKVAQIQGGTLLTSTTLDGQPGIAEGTCWLSDITVNFDDQPQGAKALTAIMTNWIRVEDKQMTTGDSTGTGGYNQIISEAAAYQYIKTENKGDMLFVVARSKEAQKQVNEYELIFDQNSEGEEVGGRKVFTMYLRSRVKTPGDANDILVEKGTPAAFNISSFMRTKGEALQAEGYDLIGVRLLYMNKVDTLENGTLNYKFITPANVNPAYIPLPKKEDK
ncbi:MAG TPA: hypothetical protein DCF91_00720 [Porphyromonadaceae bacterium]|nr:hypothetical protein [Porphyromonadaceae bacterium]